MRNTATYEESKTWLTGVAAIMLTPFHEDETLDLDTARSHVASLAKSGLTRGNGLVVVAGTSGECYALSTDERKALTEATVEAAAGGTPIVIGCNTTSVRATVDLAQHAERVGADGILLMAPYYRPLSEQDVERWFTEIASETSLPVVLYNNIQATSLDLPVELVQRLSQHDNIVGIKDCSPNIIKVERMARQLSGSLRVMNGNMECCEPYASLMGCVGFVSGIANFVPKLCVRLHRLSADGRVEDAKALAHKMLPLFDCIFRLGAKYRGNSSTVSLKTAARAAGIAFGPTRAPAPVFSPEDSDELIDHARELVEYERAGSNA